MSKMGNCELSVNIISRCHEKRRGNKMDGGGGFWMIGLFYLDALSQSKHPSPSMITPLTRQVEWASYVGNRNR